MTLVLFIYGATYLLLNSVTFESAVATLYATTCGIQNLMRAINSDYFPKQHQLICFYVQKRVFSVRQELKFYT